MADRRGDHTVCGADGPNPVAALNHPCLQGQLPGGTQKANRVKRLAITTELAGKLLRFGRDLIVARNQNKAGQRAINRASSLISILLGLSRGIPLLSEVGCCALTDE